MELCDIGPGMRLRVKKIPQGLLRGRLRQFGLVEGTEVACRYARRSIVALEWMGTAIAVRRKDLAGIWAEVMR